MAPNVNSFRRIRPNHSAPANVEWARDNRTCGLRVPAAGRARGAWKTGLPGADANPYLAIAGSLLCRLSRRRGKARAFARGDRAMPTASTSTLPRTMEEALDRFAACESGAGSARRAFRRRPIMRVKERRARPVPERRHRPGNATICCSRCDRWASIPAWTSSKSYYVATANPAPDHPPLAGRGRRRSGGGRRRLHRPVRSPACRRARAEGGAARRRQDRLGRIGAQWRPDHPRPAQGRHRAGQKLSGASGRGRCSISPSRRAGWCST